jgi:transposase InsO family protein
VKSLGVSPVRIAIRSPWQNGVAERFVESCRRDLFDHVIVLNERHMKRLMVEYVRHYHDDRAHLGLAKETPAGRVKETSQCRSCSVMAFPRLVGLHHRYELAA